MGNIQKVSVALVYVLCFEKPLWVFSVLGNWW